MAEDTIIKVRGLKKIYDLGTEKVHALDGIDLDIKKSEICCIFGTSGSGKSTLLNQLAALEEPTEGDILVMGIPLPKLSPNDLAKFRQKYIGFIFQAYNLMPTMTALENVAMPLMFRGVPKHKRLAQAKEVLSLVGLKGRLNHYPKQMSGGQQQRVGIARALITKPKIIFADEPTGNLDTKTTIEVMDMIKKFSREYGSTVILVTHERELSAYADKIVTIKDGKVISITENSENRRMLNE